MCLAGGGETSTRLWIVSEFLPLGAPGGYGNSQISARGFRHLAGDAGLVSGDEVIAFSDTHLLASGS